MLGDVREVTTSLSFSIPVLLLCVASSRILSAVLFHDLSTIIQKSTKLDQTTLYHPTHLQLLFVLRHHGGRHTTVQCKTHHLHVGFLTQQDANARILAGTTFLLIQSLKIEFLMCAIMDLRSLASL